MRIMEGKRYTIEWCGNGYYYLYDYNRLIYKSKNKKKVNARYEQMMKIQDNSERRIEQFKDNPYRMVR